MVSANRRLISNPCRHELLAAQRWRCFYCGERITGRDGTRDHLFPQLVGGRSKKERRGRGAYMNIVMACRACNCDKGCRHPQPDELARARKLYASMGKPAFEIG